MNRLLLIVPLIILIIFSCTEEEESVIEPSVRTLEIVARGDSLYFSGRVLNAFPEEIENYGFIIQQQNVNDPHNDVITLEGTTALQNNLFHMSILNDLVDVNGYTVQAFVRIVNYYYGNTVPFQEQGGKVPVISKFEPVEGKAGDYIKIYGNYFGIVKEALEVTFGDIEAEIISMNNDRIVVKVPKYQVSEEVPISVKRNNYKAISDAHFFLYGPEIVSFTPTSGEAIINMTIHGDNFSEYKWRNKVTIDYMYQGEVISSKVDEIEVQFDMTNIEPGHHYIVVETEDIIAISPSTFQTTSKWISLSPKPEEPIYNSASFVIDDKIYICSGSSIFANGNGYHNQLWEYDIKADLWTRRADFPGGKRVAAVAFAIDDKGYFGCGYDDSVKNDFWQYDPKIDQWIEKATFAGKARLSAVGFSYNGLGYVGLGVDYWDFTTKDMWQYDPVQDDWTSIIDFAGHERAKAMVAIVNDKAYIIGGGDGRSPFDPDVWEFDFNSHEWNFIAVIDRANFYPTAVFSNNLECYVLSSERNYFGIDQLKLYKYDPGTNTIINNLPIFAGGYRLNTGLSEMVGSNLYTGLGFEGADYFNNHVLLNDLWTIDVDDFK